MKKNPDRQPKAIHERLKCAIILLSTIIISFLLDNIILKLVDAIQYPLLFKLFYGITLLGEAYVFVWIAIILAAVLIINHKPVASFISGVAAASAFGTILKLIIGRSRPFEALGIDGRINTSLSSFPSGHTIALFSIIPVMSRNFPRMKIILWTIAILVGISRIYLGVHYLSDVLAGAIIGYGTGWIFMKIGEKYAWKY